MTGEIRPPSELPLGRGERILVVEDDPAIRTLVVGLLESLGYTPIAVGDGATAMEVIGARDDLDLVFTDVRLGDGWSGPGLAAQVRVQRPRLAFLFTSGLGGSGLDTGEPLDPTRMLVKPYRRHDLAQRVRAVLDQAGDH